MLDAVEFAERALKGKHYTGHGQTARQYRSCFRDLHPSA
jgi:hypothetical protein